jgi:hypothetical protein
MMVNKARALSGAIGLGLAALLALGCGGKGNGTGGAGTIGSAGAGSGGTSSVAGTTGGGGSVSGGATGSAGAGGGGGTGVALPGCPNSVAPTIALIADFATTGPVMIDKGVSGGVIAESSSPTTVPSPPLTVDSGAWHLANYFAPTGDSTQTATFGIYFSPPPSACVDAHTYAGISFKIGGTVAGCTLVYLLEDSAHRKSDDMRGSCTAASCEPARKTLTLATTPAVVQIPWAEPTGAAPSTAIDPRRLTAISWQLAIPSKSDGGGSGVCMADITIDDVTFY